MMPPSSATGSGLPGGIKPPLQYGFMGGGGPGGGSAPPLGGGPGPSNTNAPSMGPLAPGGSAPSPMGGEPSPGGGGSLPPGTSPQFGEMIQALLGPMGFFQGPQQSPQADKPWWATA